MGQSMGSGEGNSVGKECGCGPVGQRRPPRPDTRSCGSQPVQLFIRQLREGGEHDGRATGHADSQRPPGAQRVPVWGVKIAFPVGFIPTGPAHQPAGYGGLAGWESTSTLATLRPRPLATNDTAQSMRSMPLNHRTTWARETIAPLYQYSSSVAAAHGFCGPRSIFFGGRLRYKPVHFNHSIMRNLGGRSATDRRGHHIKQPDQAPPCPEVEDQ